MSLKRFCDRCGCQVDVQVSRGQWFFGPIDDCDPRLKTGDGRTPHRYARLLDLCDSCQARVFAVLNNTESPR